MITLQQRREKFLKENPSHTPYSTQALQMFEERKNKEISIQQYMTQKHKEKEEREKRKNYFAERKEVMMRMRIEEKMTLQEIGDAVGITRERVRQILKNTPRPTTTFSFTCYTCKKVVKYEAYQESKRKKYCSRECMKNRPLKFGISPNDDYLEYNRRQQRARYADPVGRQKHKEQTKRYYEKLKKDPVRWAKHKERQREYSKKYYNKKKSK